MSGGYAALARGEADGLEKSLFRPQALSTVRYADPAAWAVATATARAFGAAADPVAAAGDRIGVVVTSPRGPVETRAWIASATREGSSSPLRFPASNPGSLAGVTCIALGLRGPTLMLTMPAAEGAALGLLLGERWIARGDVALVVVASCVERAPGKNLARCVVVGGAPGGALDPQGEASWLAGAASTAGSVPE